MSPYYAQGNLIYVRPKNTNEILVGDIITYYENSGKKISTRRVIAVENNHEDFYTKADTKTYIEPGVVKREILSVVPSFRFHILTSPFKNGICMDSGVILYDCFLPNRNHSMEYLCRVEKEAETNTEIFVRMLKT